MDGWVREPFFLKNEKFWYPKRNPGSWAKAWDREKLMAVKMDLFIAKKVLSMLSLDKKLFYTHIKIYK